MKDKRREIGITLVALVITIVILIILSGIVISQLGENGLMNKVKEAELKSKKEQYYEEINLKIYDSQIDFKENSMNKSYIAILADKIKNLDSVDSVMMCDDELIEHTNQNNDSEINNTLLIITTKDEYEIYVDVDSINRKASIRKDSFSEVKEKYIVTYDINTGDSGIVESQNTKAGMSVTLRKNKFEKLNYTFIGWSKDKNATKDSEGLYDEGTKLKIEDNTTLYAIWSRNVLRITLNKNDDENNPQTVNINVDAGELVSLPLISDTFTRESYQFLGWSTTADGNIEYDDNDDILITQNTILYAKWREDRKIPEVASINIQSLSNGSKVATVLHTDNESGIDIERCKYYFSTVSDQYGIDNNIWNTANAFEQNNQQINLELDYTQTISNSYLTGYLHVLSVDNVGNKRETVTNSVRLELITIDSVYRVNTPTSNEGATTTTALSTLFNGTKSEGGNYKGLLFASGKGAYMTITVNADMTIYAYGGSYGDSGGNSGKQAGFALWNGSSYNSPTYCNTTSTASKYKLITLTKGKYKVTAKNNYVVFSEWEIELD